MTLTLGPPSSSCPRVCVCLFVGLPVCLFVRRFSVCTRREIHLTRKDARVGQWVFTFIIRDGIFVLTGRVLENVHCGHFYWEIRVVDR